MNLRLKRPSIPRGFLQDSCYREGGIGRGEVSAGAREMSRVKKSQNPSFRAGRTPRAETRAGGRRSVPNTPPAQRVQLICSVPADDRTNYPTEDSRCGQSSAQIRSGSRTRDCPTATRGFAGFYTHLDGDLAVALEPLELSGSLLDDLMLDEGSDLLSGERDARRQRHSDGARSGIY